MEILGAIARCILKGLKHKHMLHDLKHVTISLRPHFYLITIFRAVHGTKHWGHRAMDRRNFVSVLIGLVVQIHIK